MSVQSRRSSTVIRKVLREIISEPQNVPPSTFRTDQFQKIKLAEAVSFLQKKISRQQTEIKMFSEQLSKEIFIKEELLEALNQEKEKNNKLSEHLTASNRTNSEMKKKLAKTERNESEQTLKEDFEIKISKYRELVRKKDELIFKTQLKLDDMFKHEKSMNQIEAELRSMRQSFSRLKHREEILTKDNEQYKKKIAEIQQKLSQKQGQEHQLSQSLRLSQQKCKRLDEEMIQLTQQFQLQQNQSKAIELEMKELLDRQNEQLKRLSQIEGSIFMKDSKKPEWGLQVFKGQMKRILQMLIKDSGLRRKIEKSMVELLNDIQGGFRNILSKILGCY